MKHAKSDSELCFNRQRKRTRRRLRREDNQMLKMCPTTNSELSVSTSVSSSWLSTSSRFASALSLTDELSKDGIMKQSDSRRKDDQNNLIRLIGRRHYSLTRLDRQQYNQISVPLEQLFGWIREFRALISDAKNDKIKSVDEKTLGQHPHQTVSTTTSYCSTTVECCYNLTRKNCIKKDKFNDKSKANFDQQTTLLNCGCCLCCECCECYENQTIRALGTANRAIMLTKVGRTTSHERDIVDEEEDKIVRMASQYHPEGSTRSSLVGNTNMATTTNVIVARNITPSTTSNYSVPTTPNGGKVLVPRNYRIVNPMPSTDSPPLSNSSTMVRGKNKDNKDKTQYHTSTTNNKRLSNPRIHSMQGLTRAKIKTVKITLVVITCYVLCSSPFILSQLWTQWWPGAQESSFYKGKY